MDTVSNARATFWFNSAPVISRVCGSTPSFTDPTFDQEWVEIFNPTTWTWNVQRDLNLQYYLQHASYTVAPWSAVVNSWQGNYYMNNIAVTYVNTTIPPGGYFLYANTTTINLVGTPTILADAVWSAGVNVATAANSYIHANGIYKILGRFDPHGKYGPPSWDLITTAQPGVPLRHNGVYNGGGGYLRLGYRLYGYVGGFAIGNLTARGYLDSVGWFGGNDAGNPSAPMYSWMGHGDSTRREGEWLMLVDNDIGTGLRDPKGLDAGEQWIRIGSTASWQEMRDVGPAYDSDNNERDWVKFTTDVAAGPNYQRFAPRNSLWPTYSTHVVSGRYASTTLNPGSAGSHNTPWYRHNFVRAWVDDGISRPDTRWNGVSGTPHWMSTGPWGGQSPPFTNMYCEDFTGTRHQNCRPGMASLSVTRIETGTWNWGLYARHFPNPFYGYVASTQTSINVTAGSLHLSSGLVRSGTNIVYAFGEVRDVFSIPHSSIPARLLMGATVLASTGTRESGAFTLQFTNPASTVTAVDVNNSASVDYDPALGSVNLDLLGGYPVPAQSLLQFDNTFAVVVSTYSWKHWMNGYGFQLATRLPYIGYIDGHVQDADTNLGIPDVSVSAFNASSGDERSTAMTDGSGYYRLYVSTGLYRVRVVPEFEEVATPEVSPPIGSAPANLSVAGSVIYVGTTTISNAFGKRGGRVTLG
ncbi:MAG: carboxypeptidase regulatory-like domain-containing protein, partial [Elusimicrobia bacterium]